jgi:hypothetical protein
MKINVLPLNGLSDLAGNLTIIIKIDNSCNYQVIYLPSAIVACREPFPTLAQIKSMYC